MRKRFTRTSRLAPRPAARLALYSILGGCALAWSGLAAALGLGEISLHSALNQPLNADIELSDSAGLEEGDITVGLASADTFAQSGIERSFFLTDLRFRPLFRNGRKVIHVSSTKVVVEPYLNFIVQVTQPSGQVLRTYTLLIDPPGSVALAPPLLPTNARPEAVSSVAPMPSQASAPPTPPAAASRKRNAQAASNTDQGAASEALTATAAQNRQLQQSLDNLQAHLQTLEDERVEKDEQLAQLQAHLAEAQALAAARVAVAPAAVSSAPAGVDQPATTTGAQPQPTAAGDQPVPVTPIAPAVAASPPTTPAASAATPPATPPAAQPKAPLAVAPETDDLTWLLQLGALVALALLIAAWVLQRRRQRAVVSEPLVLPATVAATAVDKPDSSELPTPSPVVAQRREQAPATDALDAASIYIAYGRFNEALGVLREGLQRQPERRDLRLRILEVLGLQGDAHAYAEEEAALRASGEQDAVLEQTRARFPRLAPAAAVLTTAGTLVGVAAASTLAEQEVSEPAVSPAPSVTDQSLAGMHAPDAQSSSDLDIDFDALGDLGGPLELAPPKREGDADEFQLNLDDLSLDADWSAMDPFDAPTAPLGRAPAAVEPLKSSPSVSGDELFFSNLRELPEVTELPEEEFLSDFADEPLEPITLDDPDLDAAFLDGFSEEPVILPGIEPVTLDGMQFDSPALGDSGFDLSGEPLPDLGELSIDFDSIESQAQAADRLDQARALLAQGEPQQASWLLQAVMDEGDDTTREAARQLLKGLSS